VAVGFGVLAYLLLWWAYRTIPTLPRTAPLSVVLIGIIELQVAGQTRRRLDGRPGTRPILPLTVARLAALAKASSVTGAALAGGWAGTLGYTVPRTDEFPTAGSDAITAGLGLAAAVVLLVGGLVLERVCRVRKP
jgi:hypothetical protein